MSNDPREPFGRMVAEIWNAWLIEQLAYDDSIPWDELPPTEKELDMRIGKALYDAGFQAGADSVTHV